MLEPVVDIEDLSFTYSGSESKALAKINLKVNPGEFLTITGPSGCGKSTLALCLAGFIPHAYAGRMEGTVRIMGRNTRDYPAGGLSGIVGLVQQDPEAQFCTLTVRDEVAFGPENLCLPPEEIRERLNYALRAVGALDLKERKVYTLSGGEKQRVAIASVLAMNPSLLILDEPTASLDPFCTREVLQTLKDLREKNGISIIVIEHRLERLVPISDRLLFMRKGQIVEERTEPKAWKKYFPLSMKADHGNAMPKENNKPRLLLSIENLTAGYKGREVISGISFRAYSGETIAIMGNNGSGKTTLLLALLGIVKSAKGEIRLEGNDISKEKVTHRAQEMGLAFQNPNHQIFENTVFSEAGLAALFLSGKARWEIEQRVDRLLEKHELKQYADRNPFTLSLGEKKRLTLVSILAYSPRILILDEPLVGQDRDRVDLLTAALREHQRRGGITLMVCHEPNIIAACCQRILFLSNGQLLIDAPVKEALDKLAQLGMEEYLPSGFGSLYGKKEGYAGELL
ncbi:MAG: ABC transporter ATP-binding protein [Syntrophomonadaceae bacterium]|jgi:energy-coupling factor transporter ATP-binding protein EcfA2